MTRDGGRSIDPAGAVAAGFALVLLLVQAREFGDVFGTRTSVVVLVVWQSGVVLLTATGALARSIRLRVALYVLGGLAAFLYGLLTWSFAGIVDLAVAVAAGYGIVRALMPELANERD